MGDATSFGGWYRILDVARYLSFDNDQGLVRAFELAAVLDNNYTPSFEARRAASSWLNKFKKWGYLEFAGKVESQGARPANSYRLTQKGLDCFEREGLQVSLNRLLASVRGFEKSGEIEKGPGAAYRNLLGVASEIEKNKTLA